MREGGTDRNREEVREVERQNDREKRDRNNLLGMVPTQYWPQMFHIEDAKLNECTNK